MFSHYIICVLLVFCLKFHDCKVDESVIRTAALEYFDDGRMLRQYSDGKDTVIAIFSKEDELLECHVEKSNSKVAQDLFHQAVENPFREQQYLFQEDVAKIGRRCRKLIRDAKRAPTKEATSSQKRMLRRIELDSLLEGTQYCSRQLVAIPEVEASRSQTSEANSRNNQIVVPAPDENTTMPEDDNESVNPQSTTNSTTIPDPTLDSCCQPWQQCSVVYAMSLKENLFNPYPWPMRKCECERQFRTCLNEFIKDATDEQSRDKAQRLHDLYFEEMRPKCFISDEKTRCTDYDFWHTKCLTEETVTNLKLQNIG